MTGPWDYFFTGIGLATVAILLNYLGRYIHEKLAQRAYYKDVRTKFLEAVSNPDKTSRFIVLPHGTSATIAHAPKPRLIATQKSTDCHTCGSPWKEHVVFKKEIHGETIRGLDCPPKVPIINVPPGITTRDLAWIGQQLRAAEIEDFKIIMGEP